MKKMKYQRFLPLISALLVVLLIYFEPFFYLDSRLSDLVYQQLRPINRDIVIIGVDEETLNEYGSFSTWSREETAHLLEILYEDPATEPLLVGIDFIFQGEKDPAEDERLVKACQNHDIVAAGNLVFREETVIGEDGKPVPNKWNVDSVEIPFPALAEQVYTGFTNNDSSLDGATRSVQLYANVDGTEYENFSYMLYRLYCEKTGKTVQLPETYSHNLCDFQFAGKPGDVHHVSMASVLDGSIDASEFQGKLVLVGAYAAAMQDSYAVPNSGNNMHGVEIHANIIQALLDQATSVPVSKMLYMAVMGILVLLLTWICQKQKLGIACVMLLAATVLHMVVGRVLVQRGYTIRQFYAVFVLLLLLVYFIVEKYVIERFQRKHILKVFSKYVAPQVVNEVSKDGSMAVQLGGENRDIAVLFVDIRGFTTMSENLEPEQVVQILNEYLGLATDCIFRHGGMLDKFVGDAVMAVFNAPFDQEDYCYQAVATAWDIAQGSKQLAEKLMEKFGRTISYGIGVNCGPAVVGNIGCEFRMDYTAIGDTVNTSARLESRAGRGEILISETLYKRLEGRISCEEVGPMELKGKKDAVHVLRVTGLIG